jgi:hypothetical protein
MNGQDDARPLAAAYDADERRLLDAGWWRATNAAGEVRWIHPSTPGWANDRETALDWLASNEGNA